MRCGKIHCHQMTMLPGPNMHTDFHASRLLAKCKNIAEFLASCFLHQNTSSPPKRSSMQIVCGSPEVLVHVLILSSISLPRMSSGSPEMLVHALILSSISLPRMSSVLSTNMVHSRNCAALCAKLRKL